MKKSFDYTTASLASMSLACLVVLGGCGPQNGEPVVSGAAPSAAVPAKTATQAPTATAAAPVPAKPVVSANLGEVSHIETLTERPKGSGVGAVAGGVLGGVAGHQVGDGRGQDAATVVGAVGGALLGNKIERDRAVKVVGYRVQVKLDNGDVRTFERSQLDGLHVGDRVRVEGGQVRAA
jgi:outer membrane lipoprotein SlyB